jgi:DNA-binding CsgD family transcriptional regulator
MDVLACLTARERQVLDMTAHGLTNLQIAERLEVTVHAVKFHLATIYRKLGVANRTEATFRYLNELRLGQRAEGTID